MRSLVPLLVLSLSGCLLYFDGPDDGDQCLLLPATPAIAPAPLRNPHGLTCDSFAVPCPDGCACPEVVADIAPPPTWGACGSTCDGLGEGECAERGDCRVVNDVFCAVEGVCLTNFLGCFPTDTVTDKTIACERAFDGETCSRNPACTAYHRFASCPSDTPQDQCPREFSLCMPEGVSPGRCFAPAACDRAPPDCPVGTIAGVSGSCYSGGCIPEQDCEPGPL